ncbi:MAG: response regulator [Acidobacteriota bacterium]|nr:MAG: response regulator [Acidobacteriota bacterium]
MDNDSPAFSSDPFTQNFALAGEISHGGRFRSVSGPFLETAGIEPADLANRELSALGSAGRASTETAPLEEAFQKATGGSTSRSHAVFEIEGRGRSIIEFVFQPRTGAGSDSVYFSGYDVTHWQDEVDECQRLSDLFQAAAESAGIGFWFWYLETGEDYSTPACNAFFGLNADEALSAEKLLSRVHPEDRGYVRQEIEESKGDGGTYDLRCRLVHDDGNVFWIALKGATFQGNGAGKGIVMGSVQDINELKAVNKELERIYRLESKARDQAELANKTKDYFLAIVSHELRSPLNSILGWTKVLVNDDLDEEAKLKALGTIEKSARAQARLIEDLVDSAGITSGKLKLDKRRLNLFHILENVVNSHLPAIAQKGIEFGFDYNDKNAFVNGDSARLRQVFTNLLGNALKFTPENGRIACELRVNRSDVEVVFADTGAGIDKGHLPFIFERFKQAEDIHRQKSKGLGLGLAIVKILVEEHGGTVTAESEGEGKGARFVVRLPLAGGPDAEKSTDETADAEAGDRRTDSAALDGLRVLVVEDDVDSRNVLEIFLEQMGADVVSASSVSGAFEALEAGQDSIPDVIISDIGMPESDGFDFLTRLKASDRYRDIPAIALSAFSSVAYRERAREVGFDIYHTKPFVPDRLCSEIASLVQKK